MSYTFQQINNALTNCSSFFLRKGKDEQGETTYHLLDGCGDQDGDPFYELIDVVDYITNNSDVEAYLVRHAWWVFRQVQLLPQALPLTESG